MKLYLLNSDKSINKEIDLNPPSVIIGREVDTDINLLVPGVSRYHCKLEYNETDSNWTIKDMQSTNGTKINDKIITDVEVLTAGDTILVGEQKILFGEESHSAKTVISEQAYNMTETVQNTPPITGGDIPVFDSTDTVKHKVPIIHNEAEIENTVLPESPKVIINMPGQGAGNGGIVFEPMNDSTSPVASTPQVPQTSKPEPEPEPKTKPSTKEPQKVLLTPEPSESMVFSKNKSENKTEEKQNEKVIETPSAKDEENIDANKLKNLRIFGSKNNDSPKSNKPAKKKRVSDLLFYVVVICLAVIAISLFIALQKKTAAPPRTALKNETDLNSLIVIYEKKIITRNNIFRFTMVLDGGKVKFTLDDLISRRHYTKEDDKVKKVLLSTLLDDIKETSFLELPPQTPGFPQDGKDETRTLKIGYGKNYKEVVIKNNSAPNSFEDIERSINSFAEEYGLSTITMTPEELKSQAEISFNKAEELYKNREAKPQNLREAYKRYKLTMEYLDQFAPKPRQWNMSRKRINQIEDILKEKISDLKYDYSRYIQLKEHRKALLTLKYLIPLLELDSKDYNRYRKAKLKLENYLRRNKRK